MGTKDVTLEYILKTYGVLEEYTVTDEKVFIHISKGFDSGLSNYINLLGIINNAHADEYPLLGPMLSESNMFKITYLRCRDV